MEIIVVERSFEEPQDTERLQAAEDAVAWCLEQHAVTFHYTLVSPDRRRMVCIYRGPDAEAVRVTQRTAGLALDRAWPAAVVGETPLPDGSCFVVERTFAQPMTRSEVETMRTEAGPCLDIHRAVLARSFLSRDGRRMLCLFTAPDAETVRIINRQLELSLERVWPASARLALPL